jgi:uncharacterized protein YlzI (FlbEa/FlbD family)
VICLHKLKGELLWINPDQIIFVEGNRESVVTLLDGKHVVSSDTPEQIAEAVIEHRARILAAAGRIMNATATPPDVTTTDRHLRSVPSSEV